MKRAVKSVLQTAVASAAPLLWKLRGNSLLILMYHRVLPVGHPERAVEQPGMYVSPETLSMHLEILKQHFACVHLEDWIDAVSRGHPVARRACAVTFDDGWKDNYDYAYPVLRNAGVPATMYLVSDLVGSSYSFWPNRLARILHRPMSAEFLGQLPSWLRATIEENAAPQQMPSGLRRDEIDRVITACKQQRTDAQMLSALARIEGAAHDARDLMDWDEIREIRASGLVRFGSHTRRHTRLVEQVPQEIMQDEIVGSRAAIDAALATAISGFCYPNGDHCDAAVEIVRNNYRAAVTTRRGWNTPGSDLYRLARIGMHEDVSRTKSAFLSRLAGVG